MFIKMRLHGFSLMNVVLGVFLLSGIILLIMKTIAHFNGEQKDRVLGEELATVIGAAIAADTSYMQLNASYPLVTPSSGNNCGNTNFPLVTTIPTSYLQSLSNSGFDLMKSACVELF